MTHTKRQMQQEDETRTNTTRITDNKQTSQQGTEGITHWKYTKSTNVMKQKNKTNKRQGHKTKQND